MVTPARCPAWDATVAEVRASPERQKQMVDSVRWVMGRHGEGISDERMYELLEQALSGPELVFEGLEKGCPHNSHPAPSTGSPAARRSPSSGRLGLAGRS